MMYVLVRECGRRLEWRVRGSGLSPWPHCAYKYTISYRERKKGLLMRKSQNESKQCVYILKINILHQEIVIVLYVGYHNNAHGPRMDFMNTT